MASYHGPRNICTTSWPRPKDSLHLAQICFIEATLAHTATPQQRPARPTFYVFPSPRRVGTLGGHPFPAACYVLLSRRPQRSVTYRVTTVRTQFVAIGVSHLDS